jgi:hypothetical protein
MNDLLNQVSNYPMLKMNNELLLMNTMMMKMMMLIMMIDFDTNVELIQW